MAIYPIKLLKDEQGQPFIPLTHVNAVAGEEYTTTVLTATKQSDGHYQILNDDIDKKTITNKVVVVDFDVIGESLPTSYLGINDGTEYPMYQGDGITPLSLKGLDDIVCLFIFTGDKWQSVKVGSSDSGHTITDSNGNLMVQRSVLNFDGATTTDDPGNKATKIMTNWVSQQYETKTGEIDNGNWSNLLTDGINIPTNGYYRVWIYLALDNLTDVGREIGLKISDSKGETISQDWTYQYQRSRTKYILEGTLQRGYVVNPEIYVDNISNTGKSRITGGYVYIEYLPVKNI